MRYIALSLVFFSTLGSLLAQQVTNPIPSNEPAILFVYEETNEKLDPWLDRFRSTLRTKHVRFDQASAGEVASMDLSKYELMIVYGAVMAFSLKEPLQDWLGSEKRLSNKRVGLFVTANRWFLQDYYGQLLGMLKKKETVVVDAVSAATENLAEEEKTRLVEGFVGRLAR